MNKVQFLADTNVDNFINWLGPKLDANFIHQYTIKAKSNKKWIKFNSNSQTWTCDSIFDAYKKYYWNNNFDYNSNKLNNFIKIYNFGNTNSDKEVIKCFCELVFTWGGVVNGNYDYVNKINKYLNKLDNIDSELKRGIAGLDPNIFVTSRPIKGIRLNSGFTKIYSLLINDFIIYDSRVAQSICYLIDQYCSANGIPKVPNILYLNIPPRKGEGSGTFKDLLNSNKFGKINGSDKKFQVSNLKASWILKEVLDRNPNSQFRALVPVNSQLRALEAALFMIGY